MSNEDSSDHMDSGNAFEGDSPSPPSPVAEQSLQVSWTKSSQKSPASQRLKVAIRREQGNEEASYSCHEQWSCADLISMISLHKASKIATKYGIDVEFPKETGRPHNPPPSHVKVSEIFLKFGVQFPLHPYFVRILNHHNLTVFQLSPNGWAQMIGLFILFVEKKWNRLLQRNFHSSTPLNPTRAILDFIISPNGRQRISGPLSRLETTLVLGKMPTPICTKKVLGVPLLSQVSLL